MVVPQQSTPGLQQWVVDKLLAYVCSRVGEHELHQLLVHAPSTYRIGGLQHLDPEVLDRPSPGLGRLRGILCSQCKDSLLMSRARPRDIGGRPS